MRHFVALNRGKFLATVKVAMERLGADSNLLSIVSSYGDTLYDAEILSLLREYNASRQVLHQSQ
jgi:hypothetical protein